MARSPLLDKLRGGTTRQPNPAGAGLLKGLGVTLKTMLTPAVTRQYPHVKPDLAPRTRGVIALMDENCTVCMLCARECPDWCIYIESHKETVPASGGGGRTRTRNQLDRFAIDFALCMYCGICIEVCPFDALFWSPEFEYSTYSIGELIHEAPKLREWMDTVPPPPPLEEGAELAPEAAKALETVEKERQKALEAAARQAQEHAPRQAATGAPQAAAAGAPAVEEEIEVEAEVDQETYDKLIAQGKPERVARARAKATFVRREKARIRA
ncbi:MAG: NuoI/complex I 23 kDa subunit family protein, partial [Nitriliruptorales bacterium]